MPVNVRAPFKTRVRQALADRHLQTAVSRSSSHRAAVRHSSLAAVDEEALYTRMRQMRERTLRTLPELLEQFERLLSQNDGLVHWARNGEEVSRIVLAIAAQHGVERVVKGRSPLAAELQLTAALAQRGLRVVEIDVGDYIAQLGGESPSHMTVPLTHMRLEEISQLLQRKLEMPPTLDPALLCSTVSQRTRQEILAATMGIIGCDFAIAETGSLCTLADEGGGPLIASTAPVCVVLMGIEQLVPTVEDGFLYAQALSRSASGQPLQSYLSILSRPRQEGHPDGAQQLHLVLVDNGRSTLMAEGYGELLLCIRCSACLDVCPVYRTVGGQVFGSTTAGPIGAVLTPLLNGLTQSPSLPRASTLCAACRDACPVQIDLPRLLRELREDLVDEGQTALLERRALRAFVRTMRSRSRYESAGRVVALATQIMARLTGGHVAFLPPPLSAWTQSRHFPPFARQSFREQWRLREQEKALGQAAAVDSEAGAPPDSHP